MLFSAWREAYGPHSLFDNHAAMKKAACWYHLNPLPGANVVPAALSWPTLQRAAQATNYYSGHAQPGRITKNLLGSLGQTQQGSG